MKLEDALLALIDPDERNDAIAFLRSQPPPKAMADTINKLLVAPLEQWIDQEYERLGGRHHNGTEAGMAFLLQAEDIALRCRYGREVYPGHINLLAQCWAEWLQVMAQGAAALRANDHTKKTIQRKLGGQKRKGTRKAITLAICAMVAEMEDKRPDAILAEMEADSNGKESVLSGLREDKAAQIKIMSASPSEVHYLEIYTGRLLKISTKTIRNTISKELKRLC